MSGHCQSVLSSFLCFAFDLNIFLRCYIHSFKEPLEESASLIQIPQKFLFNHFVSYTLLPEDGYIFLESDDFFIIPRPHIALYVD